MTAAVPESSPTKPVPYKGQAKHAPPAGVRAKPVPALVGLLVILGIMGVIAQGAVGWARDFGILPYTGAIISEATTTYTKWDPMKGSFNLWATAEPHRGSERYQECGFRVRVLTGDGAAAKVLVIYENNLAGGVREKRVVAGRTLIPVPRRSADSESIELLRRSGKQTVFIVVDELYGTDVVKEGSISISLPIDWHSWSLEDALLSVSSQDNRPSEKDWQEAALEELRLITPIYYAEGEPVTFRKCTVLAQTENGKYLIVEAVWHFTFLPAATAPKVSTIALIHDTGSSTPQVMAHGSCPVAPSLTSSRVQDLARQVSDGRWTFGNF